MQRKSGGGMMPKTGEKDDSGNGRMKRGWR